MPFICDFCPGLGGTNILQLLGQGVQGWEYMVVPCWYLQMSLVSALFTAFSAVLLYPFLMLYLWMPSHPDFSGQIRNSALDPFWAVYPNPFLG